MVLSDKELKRLIMYGTLIGPIDNEQIQPASIDLRIGNFFLSQYLNQEMITMLLISR